MIVFKLERERPPYAVHGNTLYYVKVCRLISLNRGHLQVLHDDVHHLPTLYTPRVISN